MVKSIQDGPLLLSKNDYLIAGSVSGLVSRAIVQPLDVLKIRFQLQAEPICACDTSKYHGFIQAIRCISKEEGTVAFWKGHIPAQLQAIAFSAVQFLSFEVFVAWLPALGARNDPRLAFSSSSPFQTFACGCLAGGVAACTTQPLDVLRTRFIAQGEPKFYRSLSHATLYIASHEGWSGYFRGLVPSILLVAPQTGLQFAVYHTFNQLVSKVREKFTSRSAQTGSSTSQAVQDPRKNMEVGPIQSLISGGLAGMSSKSIIYPLDMAKKRMQIHGFEEARVRFGRVPTCSGLRSCLVGIWKTEGASALFKGLQPTLVKSCVSISCRFTVYEEMCRFLFHIHDRKQSPRSF